VPLEVLVKKFSHTRFEPSGFTGNPAVPIAKSITDYIFRWLGLKFLALEPGAAREGLNGDANGISRNEQQEKAVFSAQADAPSCSDCGSIMIRCGACYKCTNCGATSGCS
jgi:ribonucleoside-diphosphate reductase alpha chain